MSADLWAAVDELTNPTRQRIERDDGTVELATVPALWVQLCDSVGNSSENGTGSSKPGSRPPVDAGALALKLAIEESVEAGCAVHKIPAVGGVPAQLRLLVREFVRRGDQGAVDASVGQLRSWCGQIRTMIGIGKRDRRLRGVACVDCGASQIRRDNEDGESVLAGALVVRFSAEGAVRAVTCEACEAVFWRGDDLLRLAS